MKHNKLNHFFIHIILSVACFFIVFPILYALIKASQSEAYVLGPSLMPGKELFRNIIRVWDSANMSQFMGNTFIIALIVTIGKTILSLGAALVLVYFSFPLQNALFVFILITLLMPTEILIVGLFDLISLQPPGSLTELMTYLINPLNYLVHPLEYGLGWNNSYLAIIVPFLASATGTFLFRQHFLSIPKALGDAARMDGAGPLRYLWHVLIPMSWNTIGALSVIQFVYVWNQYLWPRVIIRREEQQMVQVGLNLLIGVGEGIQWNVVMAGVIITMIPPLLVFLVLHEQFIKGFALTESK
ncbi:carbohydrate ABC transporter permease [Spirochaeta cellobiosiphila]|uniref:carbohydrate ABC transporter permease n=1 Tax=Spirochaeta cellobiosiphila TaxID=504483 RepID=UPI0003FA85CD|nr:carbohydrate ABC transporter permease [Spirochaeta cellobiosiphila]